MERVGEPGEGEEGSFSLELVEELPCVPAHEVGNGLVGSAVVLLGLVELGRVELRGIV